MEPLKGHGRLFLLLIQYAPDTVEKKKMKKEATPHGATLR